MTTMEQPDWDTMAEKFDIFLPQLAPVGDALLDVLQAVSGNKILDLASGTGEPALSLARLCSGADITGVDAAAGMVRVAQKKVEQQDLNNLDFKVMPAEKLDFPDQSFDRILCRFGVMLFDNPQQGLGEMSRVLKTGGRYAFAVWSTPETMTSMVWACKALDGLLPESVPLPPLAIATSLSADGVLDGMLKEAGLMNSTIEKRRFNYHFTSFDAFWTDIVNSGIMKQQLDTLDASTHERVRTDIEAMAAEHITSTGLSIPHEYILVSGNK